MILPNVLVSHPGKQGNVYQRPRAAERAGCAVTFLTGLYYFPERLPYSLARYVTSSFRARMQTELEKRRQSGLSSANVVSLWGPGLELILRPMGLIREWWAVHDRLASGWLRKRKHSFSAPIVHCFQDAGLHTLQTAKDLGALRILEVTCPPIPRLEIEHAEKTRRFERSQRLLAARLCRELDHTEWAVAQSEYSVRSIAALGFPRERILCVPLGVDTQLFTPPQLRPATSQLFRVLFVGSITARKGVQHLLRAWRELKLVGSELVLVGDNETSEARELLAKCDVSVKLVGRLPLERLIRTYQSADVLVHPSLAEGGCNVVHEALACGLPCIVSPNATSALRNGVEGYVVPVADVDALKQRMSELAASPSTRREMSVAARQRALELSWDSYAQRLGRIYLDLGRDPGAMPRDARMDVAFGVG